MDSSQLDIRLSTIEQRLTRIEGRIGISVPRPPVTVPPTNSLAQPTISPVNPLASVRQDSSSDLYEPKPGNWLGIVAIACFVLATGFIIKLSIDSGWLTPARQIGIATLFGFSLIGAGFMLLKSDRGYASLLPGAGIIVLYVTAFASYRYYALISFEFAIFMSALVSALCVWLYTEIRHDLYPITAAAGSYIAPIILGFDASTTFSIYYFIVCSLAFAIISVWAQSRTLTMVSAYLAILVSGAVGMELHEDALIAGALVCHFLIFSVGTYFYTSYNNHPLTENESWNFLPVLLVFYAMEYHFINLVHYGLAPWFSLGFTAVLIGLYLAAKACLPGASQGSRPLLIIFTTIVCFHSVYLELLPADFRPWLFVAIVIGFFFLPVSALSGGTKAFYAPALALLAILAIEYITMIFHLLGEYNFSWLVVSFASLASLWFVLIGAEDKVLVRDKYGYALLGAAHLMAVSAFYRLTEDSGSLAISASWLLYAVCVMIFAFVRKDSVMAKSALLVLSFAAGKALLYDAAAAATEVRIVCLLLTGVVLYGAGFLMRKISSWAR